MLRVSVPVFVVFCCAICLYSENAYAGPVLLNSNAIKNLPGGVANPSHPVSASPDVLPFDSGSQNMAIDTLQVKKWHVFSVNMSLKNAVFSQFKNLCWNYYMLMRVYFQNSVYLQHFSSIFSRQVAWLTKNAVMKSFATGPEAPVYLARNVGNAVSGTLCAALATTAAMVSATFE